MFIPILIYLIINIWKPLQCAPKLGGILSDPLFQEARHFKYYQPQLSDKPPDQLTKNNNNKHLKHASKQTSKGRDLLQESKLFKYITKFPNVQDQFERSILKLSTQKPENDKDTAKLTKLQIKVFKIDNFDRGDKGKIILEEANKAKFNETIEFKPCNDNLKLISGNARKANGDDNPETPKKPCHGYIYDEQICKIVNDRVLCGYNRNTGEIKPSVIDMGNNCRMIDNRIECGYTSPPYIYSRRPPANYGTTKPAERAQTPSKGEDPENEINEGDEDQIKKIPPSDPTIESTSDHDNTDMRIVKGSEASKEDVDTRRNTIKVQSNSKVKKRQTGETQKEQLNSNEVINEDVNSVEEATKFSTKKTSGSTVCVDRGTTVVCYET